MQFTYNALIDRARVYIDDDHKDNGGFLSPEQWLTLANVEYAQLRKRWIRMGLVTPAHTDTPLVAGTVVVSGVLCTIGVAQDLGGGRYRVLKPANAALGTNPFWNSGLTGWGEYWEAHGSADNITYTIEPRDTSGTYFVRTIGTFPYATDATTSIDLPYGGDEVMVLGMAKRAGIKDHGHSKVAEDLLRLANEEMTFQAFGGLNHESPRVRCTPRTASAALSFNTNPAFWRY